MRRQVFETLIAVKRFRNGARCGARNPCVRRLARLQLSFSFLLRLRPPKARNSSDKSAAGVAAVAAAAFPPLPMAAEVEAVAPPLPIFRRRRPRHHTSQRRAPLPRISRLLSAQRLILRQRRGR